MPDAFDEIRLVYDELVIAAESDTSDKQLAAIFTRAQNAERDYKVNFYKDLVSRLSSEGQTGVAKFHDEVSVGMSVTDIDFMALEADARIETENWLRDAANHYKQSRALREAGGEPNQGVHVQVQQKGDQQ